MSAKRRVLVAMSGGVDSSVAALLLLEAGFEVHGATLLMHPGCDAPEAELLELTSQLNIPLHVIPAQSEFSSRVIVPAAQEYAAGRTPNPCCECNEKLKFAMLFEQAKLVGAESLATGHYCIVEDGVIRRGRDRGKDQSYFLYRLKQEVLPFLRFPLGDLTKAEVRAIAERAGVAAAKRPDSQDTCFAVPGECCGDTLFRRAGMSGRPGNILYGGRIVGRHSGIHRCTIGQRGKMGVALGVPAYVKSINGTDSTVELCTDRMELARNHFFLNRVNWQQMPQPGENIEVQIRYRSRSVPCRLSSLEKGICRVDVDEPLFAVTPGQSGVIYSGDSLLGGGVITLDGMA